MLFEEEKLQLKNFKKLNNLNFFNKKKILITGCNGFIGSSILRILNDFKLFKKIEIKLYGIVREKSKIDNIILKKLMKQNKIELFKINIHKKINLNFKPDIIIHCASITAPEMYRKEPVETILTNSLGTINLLNYAKDKNTKKFVFISAGEIYGNFKNQKRKKLFENNFGLLDPSKIISNYGISKKFAENLLVCWGKKYKIKTNSARLFHTYGPLMKLGDGRIHSDLIMNVVKKQNLIIKGNYNVERSFCYITDIVLGILTIILKGKDGESYNIANPNETLKVMKLAERIAKISNKKIIIKRQDNYSRNNFKYPKISISKIKKLGWMPSVNINSGLKRTINFFIKKNNKFY